METAFESCAHCSHSRDVHHSLGCDGNLAAERAFWREFEDEPGFMQTREAIDSLEREQPKPCGCSAHRYACAPPTEAN